MDKYNKHVLKFKKCYGGLAMKITMKILLAAVLSILLMANALAVDYNHIDIDDRYYINRWFTDNEHVVVVRKMGNGKVKVRDLSTRSTKVVDASELLTKSDLEFEELRNGIGAGAVIMGGSMIYCLVNPECGE